MTRFTLSIVRNCGFNCRYLRVREQMAGDTAQHLFGLCWNATREQVNEYIESDDWRAWTNTGETLVVHNSKGKIVHSFVA